MKYHYFISCAFVSQDNNAGFVNLECTLSEKITSIELIKEIEKDIIQEKNFIQCSIINFKLLRTFDPSAS